MIRLNKKIRVYLLATVLFLALTAAFGLLYRQYNSPVSRKSPGPSSLTARSRTEIENDIAKIYKSLAVSSTDNRAGTVAAISRLCGLWREYESVASREKQDEVNALAKNACKANELAKENDLVKALAMAVATDQESVEKSVNPQLAIDPVLVRFYEQSRDFLAAAGKENISRNLNDLKYTFTELKSRPTEGSSGELLAELERTIGDLDRLLPGPDYEQARSRLSELTEEIYFGKQP